jgi:7,8-dihydropterin-6-yl-methyl-4-(beta-D-ribofuranosyl)aminobenzene 5'-phosphate synthase
MGALHAFLLSIALSPTVPDSLPHQARALRVTVLSTMLTDHKGVGEWGFAAPVEVDGRRLLFDTGARPETVLQNARELGIDLPPSRTSC